MKKINLYPNEGIDVEILGEISFGETKDQIKTKLGHPDFVVKNKWFFDDLKIRFDFNEKDRLEFIEFIDGPFLENIEISLFEINPFKIPANELVQILKEKGGGNVNDKEAQFAYSFPDISIGLWRQFTEEIMLESIKELKENGEYEEDKEIIEEDLEKSKYFWTIGLGEKGYYNW